MKRRRTSIVALIVMLATVSAIPAGAKSTSYIATGTVYDASGQIVANASVTAYLVQETADGEEWLPVSSSRTDRLGNFRVTAPPTTDTIGDTVRASGNEALQMAFIAATPDGAISMYTTYFDSRSALLGRWKPEEAGADAAPSAEDSSMSVATQTGGVFTASLGATRSSGVGLNLVLSTAELGAEPISTEPGADLFTDPAVSTEALEHEVYRLSEGVDNRRELDQTANSSLPNATDCRAMFGRYDGWSMEWRNWRGYNRASVRSVYIKTNSGSAKVELQDKKETKVEVAFKKSGRYAGSMGFFRDSTDAYGEQFDIGTYKHRYIKLEMQYKPQGFYCTYRINGVVQERRWTGHYRDAPDRWTGGSSLGGSTRGTFSARWQVRNAGTEVWVSRYETNQISGGVSIGGLSLKSQQKHNSGYKLKYLKKPGSSRQTLRGNNDFPVNASFIQQIDGDG